MTFILLRKGFLFYNPLYYAVYFAKHSYPLNSRIGIGTIPIQSIRSNDLCN
ncbi:MAG: hypothetical protein PHR16_00635 [Methylovulum sp.]|nr:hypothetical protein [Methylovulum sp.]